MAMKRREFLQTTLAGAAALAGGSWLAGCGREMEAISSPEHSVSAAALVGSVPAAPPLSGPAREFKLVAAPGEVEVAPQGTYHSWFYNGKYPGPEIRLREGERLRVTAVNKLSEGTTVHWHGQPVPNAMDGVPGVTQPPIAPGEKFVYDFIAQPAGSYMYHSHFGLQIDRGLIGALIVEEKQPHVAYDREYTLVLDDFLPGAPQPLEGGGMMGGGSGMMGGGMMGRGGGMMGSGGGMMGGGMMAVPPYTGLLINGHLPENPTVFETKRGERVRFRLLNPSGATTYRIAFEGHAMSVTHTDGHPVQPHTVDALDISMGERYDVVIEAKNPGAWNIVAAPLEGNAPPARAVLRYKDAAQSKLRDGAVPVGLRSGRVLDIADLQALNMLESATPDRTLDLTLSGGMMNSAWTINGQAYPQADALEIHQGERVRVRMINHSMMLHPMHLHGHTFRTGKVMKDTVILSPHMGRASFDFVADNPGNWFFHCHNIYHLASGMARVFRYV